jgi:hypothetical protein
MAMLCRFLLTTGAVCETIRDNGLLVGISRAGLVGAVADTVSEVHIGTKACSIGLVVLWGTAKCRSLAQHIVDASLLREC